MSGMNRGEVSLGANCHGKGRVRMVKVTRRPDGYQEVLQISVQILLEGDIMGDVFKTGDNAPVVATDTCKNTVYCLGKMHDFTSIEEFGVIVCKHFIAQYPEMVNRVSVEIIKDRWERVNNKDSSGRVTAHKHAFKRLGPNRPFVHVQGQKRYRSNDPVKISMQAGFTDLEIMKTTQSGFTGFHRDRFTSLPEVKDRLVGTSVTAEWVYTDEKIRSFTGRDYDNVNKIVEDACVDEFSGPADTGVYSNSVQQTLYNMGKAAILRNGNALTQITLNMPNIHNLPFDLTRFGFPADPPGVSPTIFYPIDEPHGMIKATVHAGKLAGAAGGRNTYRAKL
jgi:urate oxidase